MGGRNCECCNEKREREEKEKMEKSIQLSIASSNRRKQKPLVGKGPGGHDNGGVKKNQKEVMRNTTTDVNKSLNESLLDDNLL